MDNDSDKSPKDLNPSQQDYREKFEDLANAENNAAKAVESGGVEPDVDDVKNREESGSSKQGLYRPTGDGSAKGGMKLMGNLKKRGPMTAIAGLLLGGGMGVGLLFSPGLLIVQLKEVMVSRFNQQAASMDARTTRILDAKTKQATAGACTTIKIKCRYASMSERQIKKFEDAGIKVDKGEKNSFNRYKPKSMTFNGETIPASEFNNRLRNDLDFRKAVRQAYNPKFASFADSAWTKIKARFGVDKSGPKAVDSVDDMKKNLHEKATNGSSADVKNPVAIDEDSCASSPCTQTELDEIKEKNARAQADLDAIKSSVDTPNVGKIGIASAANAVKIAGGVDNACQLYGAMNTISVLAKGIRGAQLAIYAMSFLSVADKIKAGNATPEEVSQLGTILTSEATNPDGTLRKAATDSFGYKYAAYGDTSTMSEYTSLFLVGGGLTGKFSGLTKYVRDTLGGKKGATSTCKFLANPLVQVGSLVAGVAFMFTGIGVGKIFVQGLEAAAIMAVTMILPQIAADIIAGNTVDNIQGEDSGDAITSGSGYLMSSWANVGGNAPMTKDQALAYNKLNQETMVAYLKDEASELSPLDPTNKYTFMGSIAYSLMPYYSSGSLSMSSSLTKSLSFIGSAFSNILPKASALSSEQEKAAMEVCQDEDYADMGFATDPFCNPMFGIPVEYLDADPMDVVDYLKNEGYFNFNADGTDYLETDKYQKWKDNCVNRSLANPFGFDDTNSSEGSDGQDCLIKGSNAKATAYLYLNLIDQRIESGMDGYTN